MTAGHQTTVANRPAQPLIVFDGQCGFCRQWVDRWRGMSGPRVDYRPFQEAAGDFPEIGADGFKARVWLIEPDGTARGGAGAVFRLDEVIGLRAWPRWLHEHFPGVALVAETGYDFVARHREAAMGAIRLLCGSVDRRPSYRRTRAIFVRGMGVAYLAAFASLAVQMGGLFGSRGIAPVAEVLDRAGPVLGSGRFWQIPTVFWINASDGTLHVLCWGGVALAGLVVVGCLAGECLLLLWMIYLSFVSVGRPFLGYQWDALLLEAGLLAILLAPWNLRLDRAARGPSPVAVGLARWLLFRLMFLAGVVKLTSGDPTWSAWDALRYHYETQPIPSWTSWYMHQSPPWFQKVGVGYLFWAELIAPFCVFGPRNVRLLGFASMSLLQLLIAATGNYGFFNLLAVVLCLILVEDRDWGRREVEPVGLVPRSRWRGAALGVAAVGIVAVTTMEGLDRVGATVAYPGPLEQLREAVAPFQSLNSYGLFAVMTTERPEIEVEGSDDGDHWQAYGFRWKPGDLGQAPRFTGPHLPRLDWQMWFAALGGDCRTEPWFLAFERRLLEGSPEVLGLLDEDPFASRPPRFVRARLYRYHFTHGGQSAWWRREDAGSYCPPAGL